MNNKKKENKTSKELNVQLKSILSSETFEARAGMGTGGTGTGSSGPYSCCYTINNAPVYSFEDVSWTANGDACCIVIIKNNKFTIDSALFSLKLSGNNNVVNIAGGGSITCSGNTIIFRTSSVRPSEESEDSATIEATESLVTLTVDKTITDSEGKVSSSERKSQTGNVYIKCIVEFDSFFKEFRIADVNFTFGPDKSYEIHK